MSHDVKTRLRDLAEAMPPAPGDLDTVQRRARQRSRHERIVAVAGVAALVLVVGAVVRLPGQPSPVIQGDQPAELVVTPDCPPQQQCPDLASVVEEAAATLRDDPAVREVEVVDPDTRRRQMVEALDVPLDQLPADSFAPALRVVVRPGDEQIASLARRLRGAVPDASVRRGPVEPDAEGFDPAAAVGPARDVVEVDLGDRTITARTWPVAAGGRCVEVGDLVSCGVDRLLADHPAPSGEEEAWGRPEPDVTCAWAPVGDGIEAVTATFANGVEATGRIGPPPSGVLAGVVLACVDARTHPVAVEYTRPDAGPLGGTIAPSAEVRPPGTPGWPDLAALAEQLTDDLADDLVGIDDRVARREAVADIVADLQRPDGIEDLTVYDTATGAYPPGDDGPGTQVAAEVTPAQGDPICMVVRLLDADSTLPWRLHRPAVWTPDDGCPPLP